MLGYPTLQEDLRRRIAARIEGVEVGYGETHSLRNVLGCSAEPIIRDLEMLAAHGVLEGDEAKELVELKALVREARALYQLG